MSDLLLVLTFGLMAGWLAKRVRLPQAVVLVLLGVVLGPALLGWIALDGRLAIVGELGIVLLLGMAGLQMGVAAMWTAGRAGVSVAVLGIGLSLIAGYFFMSGWGARSEAALYTGLALAATSVGISVQVLQQFGLISRRVGRIVIAAAVIDDIAALYLLAVAHGVLRESLTPVALVIAAFLALLVIIAIYAVCQLVVARIPPRWLGAHPVPAVGTIALALIAGGTLSHLAGLSSVVGAFFAGLGIGEGAPSLRQELARRLEPLVFVLMPFFFVLIGARAEWTVLTDAGMAWLVAGLIVLALCAKTIGGALGAVGIQDKAGRWLIGASMAPRGEVALVIASLGFAQGHVGHHLFVALVLMAIATALVAPLLMLPLARRHRDWLRAQQSAMGRALDSTGAP